MLGINGLEFILLAIIAVMVLGPERLPEYATQLGRLVKELRRMATGARQQLRDEVGSEFSDVDWQKLDPRQYDPRRIIREALLDDDDAPAKPRNPGGPTAQPNRAPGTDAGTGPAAASATAAAATSGGSAPAGTASSAAAGPDIPAAEGEGAEESDGRRIRKLERLAAGQPAPFDAEAT